MLNAQQNTKTVHVTEFQFVPSFSAVRGILERLSQQGCLLSSVDVRKEITKNLSSVCLG